MDELLVQLVHNNTETLMAATQPGVGPMNASSPPGIDERKPEVINATKGNFFCGLH